MKDNRNLNPIMGVKYVVTHFTRLNGADEEEEFLVALNYDPYNTGSKSTFLSPDKEEAFIFSTLAAAEIAAVWIGGEVKTSDYKITVSKSKGGQS